ncbi:MAG: chemotaxis protein CheR [Spirochaetia bacterium]|jgi:chemotaxis methyl-accepting protein methylase|nr:chemotaxis protein CheR [Spirochaetia bacterium]
MILTEEIPAQLRSDPALLYLYNRTEAVLGIRPAPEDVEKLKEYMEKRCGFSRFEPESYDRIFSDREEVFTIARMLTVNETYFFREPMHFKLLARHLLPKLAKLRRTIQICSAATSSGCEAYSLAMLIDFYSRGRDINSDEHSGISFKIDAFDVSRNMIEIARQGRYTPNSIREDGSQWKFLTDLYLRREGDEYYAPEILKDKINFYPHNIMDGLNGQYDIIFFRNAMIYFSPENREKLFSILADALSEGGALFPGVSETSSVEHPLLESKHNMDVFYFKKRGAAVQAPVENTLHKPPQSVTASKPVALKPPEEAPDPQKIAALLEDENQRGAENILSRVPSPAAATVNELTAAAISFLGRGEFVSADAILSVLEEKSVFAPSAFLRGEYHYRKEDLKTAEAKYQEASARDKTFWPAFYRLASLAAEGNQTRYEYKINKALESMKQGEELHHEIYIGGFSPDYYRQILERKRGNK